MFARTQASPGRRGFTLVELLVVIAIIAVLISLLLPAAQRIREAAARTQCQNNLRQLALALQTYHNSAETFPAGLTQDPGPFRGTTFFVRILPYIEQDNLYKGWDFTNLATNSSGGAGARSATVIKTLICPMDIFQENPFTLPASSQSGVAYAGMYAGTSYAGNHGTRNYYPTSANANGMFFTTGPASAPAANQQPVRFGEVTDGTTTTILLGEKYHFDIYFDGIPAFSRSNLLMHQWSVWAWSGGFKGTGHVFGSALQPINYRTPQAAVGQNTFLYQDLRVNAWGSGHLNGANFAFVDGSVHFLKDGISQTTLQFLSTRGGGEVITETY